MVRHLLDSKLVRVPCLEVTGINHDSRTCLEWILVYGLHLVQSTSYRLGTIHNSPASIILRSRGSSEANLKMLLMLSLTRGRYQ